MKARFKSLVLELGVLAFWGMSFFYCVYRAIRG